MIRICLRGTQEEITEFCNSINKSRSIKIHAVTPLYKDIVSNEYYKNFAISYINIRRRKCK